MEQETQPRKKRWVFSIRMLLVLMALVACGLTAMAYRARALKPDLTITAADVAWANDIMICKIDLSDAGTVYGLQLVAFENGGTKKTRLCKLGANAVADTKKYPLVMIAMKREGSSVRGKLWYIASTSFEAKDLFTQSSTSWSNRPTLNENLYYLMSDSQTIGFGKEPFEEGSNSIALEIIRTPQP